jgi:hypothetical protein
VVFAHLHDRYDTLAPLGENTSMLRNMLLGNGDGLSWMSWKSLSVIRLNQVLVNTDDQILGNTTISEAKGITYWHLQFND